MSCETSIARPVLAVVKIALLETLFPQVRILSRAITLEWLTGLEHLTHISMSPFPRLIDLTPA
jgi:hypothetical protein